MKKILVTGAGGYIGSTLVPLLLGSGYSVRAVDRFFFGEDKLQKHPNLEIIREDTRTLNIKNFEGVFAVIDLVAISNDPSGELFKKATFEINRDSRVRTAILAKQYGVSRYILPSSCSIYGFTDQEVISDEESPTNPLTNYAKANEQAEKGILPLHDEHFIVTVLRQSTVYGYSPRMRFDLAINGMTHGAWKTRKLPLMRNGKQWRPMVHVTDTARAQIFMLDAPAMKINGQIFNVGSEANNYQLGDLAKSVARAVGVDVSIEWYGDPDHRSYRVNFKKIENLGYKAEKVAEDGVQEIIERLELGELAMTDETITLQWYKNLVYWNKKLKELQINREVFEL